MLSQVCRVFAGALAAYLMMYSSFMTLASAARSEGVGAKKSEFRKSMSSLLVSAYWFLEALPAYPGLP